MQDIESFDIFYSEHVENNSHLNPPEEYSEYDINNSELVIWNNHNKECLEGLSATDTYKQIASILVDVIAKHSKYVSWKEFVSQLYAVFDAFIKSLKSTSETYFVIYGEVDRGGAKQPLDFEPTTFRLNKDKSFYWLTCLFAKYVREHHSEVEQFLTFCEDPTNHHIERAVYIDDASYSGSQMDERIRATSAKTTNQPMAFVLCPYITLRAEQRIKHVGIALQSTVSIYSKEYMKSILELIHEHYEKKLTKLGNDDLLYQRISTVINNLTSENVNSIVFTIYANMITNSEMIQFDNNNFGSSMTFQTAMERLNELNELNDTDFTNMEMSLIYNYAISPWYSVGTYNIRNISPVYFFHKIADNYSSVPLVYGQGRMFNSCQSYSVFHHFLNGCEHEPEDSIHMLELKGSQKSSSCSPPFYKSSGGKKSQPMSMLQVLVKHRVLREVRKVWYYNKIYTVYESRRRGSYIVVKRKCIQLKDIAHKYRYVVPTKKI